MWWMELAAVVGGAEFVAAKSRDSSAGGTYIGVEHELLQRIGSNPSHC